MESSAGQGPPPCPPGGNQSQLVCGGCAVLLMYPQGASNVRCSRCTYINPVAGRDMAQLVCQGCRVLLMYPRGANSVQCSLCSSINPAQQVKCAVCNHLTSINSSSSNAPAPTSTVQHVFIENPPSLDEHGNEVVNIAVGLTEKPVPVSSSA